MISKEEIESCLELLLESGGSVPSSNGVVLVLLAREISRERRK